LWLLATKLTTADRKRPRPAALTAIGRAVWSARAEIVQRRAADRYRICIPEIAREITRRWISEVPSKIE
jgi:hypothetical protein